MANKETLETILAKEQQAAHAILKALDALDGKSDNRITVSKEALAQLNPYQQSDAYTSVVAHSIRDYLLDRQDDNISAVTFDDACINESFKAALKTAAAHFGETNNAIVNCLQVPTAAQSTMISSQSSSRTTQKR